MRDFYSKFLIRKHPSELILDNNISKMLFNLNQQDFITVKNDAKEILLKKGKSTISDRLVVPPNYKLIIGPDTHLDLINFAKIISYSPLLFRGLPSKPSSVISSDNSSGGITILNANDQSVFEYVDFSNLKNLNEKSWYLSGSINIYKSNVLFNNCSFRHFSGGDDSLNIIDSNFTIQGCYFKNSYSDALDVDYGSGKIISTTFVNSGNDAIDISGARVLVDKVFIDGVQDKAISVGERSDVTLTNISINETEIGITSKDGSRVNVDTVDFSNTRIGICAFRKKNEFGPAKVISESISGFDNLEIPFLLEKESVIIHDSQPISPSSNAVRSLLYGVKYGKSSK